VVSRGEGLLGFSPKGSLTPHVAICARERSVEFRRKEVWKLTAYDKPVAPMPLKSLSYLPHVLAKKQADETGFDDAILTNASGEVIECTGSNLFLVKRNVLITPPLSTGCLPGITRGEVFKIAKKEGFKVVEKTFKIDACKSADGMFLTNSLLEIVPSYYKTPMDQTIVNRIDELEAAFAYHRATSAR
jgi:branched-chain amino acid aminotransferase